MKGVIRTGSVMSVVLALAMSVAAVQAGESGAPGWSPTRTVEFVVSSSPGGGSDIFTRTIADIMAKQGLVKQTIMVNNQTDGGGAVSRARVSAARDDNMILAFMSGGIAGMLANTDLTMADFTPLGIMASDKQLLFKGEHTKYKDMKEMIDAAKAGTKIIAGGSIDGDVAAFELFRDAIGLTPDEMVYIIYNSTSEAVTGMLGGHIELCIGKPAATMQYVKAGKMEPILALSKERFPAPFENVPLLSDLGYENVEFPIWRGIVGPKAMSPEAVEYWSRVLGKVAETPEWQAYLEKNALIPFYFTAKDAKPYMTEFEGEVRKTLKQ